MDAIAPNADSVVEQIDRGVLTPRTHKVVRELHRHMPLKEALQRTILSIFDEGEQCSRGEALSNKIWALIDDVPADQQSGLRLSNCLTRPDEAVDWQLTEYLVL